MEHYGTGGGLLRPLFAEALQGPGMQAGVETTDAADAYRRLGAAWSGAAAAALPLDVAAFARLRELVDDTYAEYFAEGPAAEGRLDTIRRERQELLKGPFPLSETEARTHLLALADHVEALAQREREALDLLRACVPQD